MPQNKQSKDFFFYIYFSDMNLNFAKFIFLWWQPLHHYQELYSMNNSQIKFTKHL